MATKRWHYKIIFRDNFDRRQEHFTNAAILEHAIGETQSLADYDRLEAWVNFEIGESGFFVTYPD